MILVTSGKDNTIKEFKKRIMPLFDPCVPCVNAMRWWLNWLSRMEVSYFTFRFDTFVQPDLCHYHYCVIQCAITYNPLYVYMI